MGSARKTMQLDLLQLNALNFKTTSNTNIPSTFILAANGDGTTSFGSISSFMTPGYTTVSVPGQHSLYSMSNNLTLSFSTSTELFISTSQQRGIVWLDINATSTVTSTLNYALISTGAVLNNTVININAATDIKLANLGSVGYVSSLSLASTMFNILTYPNICSSIGYQGNNGVTALQGLTDITNSGSANFSSFQYNFSNFSQYINPNGSSRVFIDYNPSFTFSHVEAPSSISSMTLYPEGNSSIKNLLSLSSHFVYYQGGQEIPIDKSAIQQYIPVNSLLPFGLSTNTRVLSNTFIQGMTMEVDGLLLDNAAFGLKHYLSDAVVYKSATVDGENVCRTGLDRSNVQINITDGDKNNLFIRIHNSGNVF